MQKKTQKPDLPGAKIAYTKQDWGLRGITGREAVLLLEKFGTNEVLVKRKVSDFAKLLTYFKNPMIIILLCAAALSGFFGDYRSTIVIFAMAVSSVILNFYQERKSGKEVEKLQERLSLSATVVRDGEQQEVSIKSVVPGDTAVLSAGDIVPADGEIIKCDDLFINESALTGESFPIEKRPAGGAAVSQRNKVFAGSNVISGSGFFKVGATGRGTVYGKIAEKIQAPEEEAFEKGIRSFGFLIIRATVFIVLCVFLIITLKPILNGGALTKSALVESFLFAIAIAVGLTPELLPVIMSVNMSKGSIRMSKKGVLVKRLNAIPDFGSMDILCTDKTGTLTEDKITLVKYVDLENRDSEDVLRHAYLNSAFQTGLKNPLDAAVLSFRHLSTKDCVKIDEIPYDFHRKRISVVAECRGERLLITKGQPEEIFKISKYYSSRGRARKLSDAVLLASKKIYEAYSQQGFKTLAVAVKKLEEKKDVYRDSEEKGMILAGFIAFYDPPKQTAAETLVKMKDYGVEVKIITGDNELVAQKICRDLNLKIKGVMVGDELARISDDALGVRALATTIFARFSPEQKNRVIGALRARNKVVGYMGDGINDAPSLKSADVGISVDNAVDVARETADIILTRKSLRVLTEGIIEGRKTFGNTMKYLMMGISSNFGNMFSVIVAALYLPFLPMRPIQVLLNNTLYDISQITIPSDNVDVEYLKKPKHWNMKFVKKYMLVFGLISSVFDVLTFLLLFGVFHFGAAIFQAGWFLESLATQTFVIYLIRTKRFVFKSRPSFFLIASTIGAVFAGLLFATTALGNYFSFRPLPLAVVGIIFAMVLAYLVIVEAVKHWFYRKHDL